MEGVSYQLYATSLLGHALQVTFRPSRRTLPPTAHTAVLFLTFHPPYPQTTSFSSASPLKSTPSLCNSSSSGSSAARRLTIVPSSDCPDAEFPLPQTHQASPVPHPRDEEYFHLDKSRSTNECFPLITLTSQARLSPYDSPQTLKAPLVLSEISRGNEGATEILSNSSLE